MRRVIGFDIHRTFGEVVVWEDSELPSAGRIDMTRTALEGFGKSLRATDEVVIEATGNCMAVSRVLSHFVRRVVIAKPHSKGNRRGPAYAYDVKTLRTQEMRLAEQAERSYEHLVEHWQPRCSKAGVRERLKPARPK